MQTVLLACLLAANADALTSHQPSDYYNLTSYLTSVGYSVVDSEETLKFYHNPVGLVVLHQDKEPFDDPAYGKLTNTSTATYRSAVVAIPRQIWNLNLVEYIGVPKEQIKQREQDPSDPGLTLTVKNSSAINDALGEGRREGARVHGKNGRPFPDLPCALPTSRPFSASLCQRAAPKGRPQQSGRTIRTDTW